jgi:hypothetical protein
MHNPVGSTRSWSCAACGRRLIVPDAPIDLATLFCDAPPCQQAMKRDREERAELREVAPRDLPGGAYAGLDGV